MTTAIRCFVLLPLAGLLAGCTNSPASVADRDPIKESDPFQAVANSAVPSESLDVWHQPAAQVGQSTALAAPDPYREQAWRQQATGWKSTDHVTHPEYQSVSSPPVQTAAVTDATAWETPAEDVSNPVADSHIEQTNHEAARPLTGSFEEAAVAETDKPVFADSPARVPEWWSE